MELRVTELNNHVVEVPRVSSNLSNMNLVQGKREKISEYQDSTRVEAMAFSMPVQTWATSLSFEVAGTTDYRQL